MKALSKKQLISLLSMIVLSLLVGISPSLYQKAKASNRLGAEQIADLRSQYPICSGEGAMVSRANPSLDELVETMDSFVYAEVDGEMTTFSKQVSLGIPALEAKQKENGGDGGYEFYQYNLTVISDTEGEFQSGEEIKVVGNMMFLEGNPKLEDGMRIVFGTIRTPGDPSNCGMLTAGTYYVTEDGYALSAFEESQENMQGRSAYTGLPVEQLLYQLKKR